MERQAENLLRLIDDIQKKIGRPVSDRVVAATIESFGIRDIDVREDYGLDSITELSTYIYKKLTHPSLKNKSEVKQSETVVQKEPQRLPLSDYFSIKNKLFINYYPLGIFHLLPIFIQILSIIIFGFSLWTHVEFNHLQSTAVVLGVILGLIITGGVVQVLGRQGSFFWNYNDYEMTFKSFKFIISIGVKSLLIFLGIIAIVNVVFNLYPTSFIFVVVTYAFLIGLLLLVLAPYHTIKQRWMISLSVLTGTGVTIFLNLNTPLLIYATHWIGIATAALICWIYLNYFFRKKLKKERAKNLDLNKAVILYQNFRFFLYGFLIFVFIFIDRILAWSGTFSGKPNNLIIYFEKNYELGMDIAILAFLLMAGVMEYSIASFSKLMDLFQKNIPYHKFFEFNQRIQKLYNQHIALLFGSGILTFILIYLVMHASWGYKGQFNEELEELSIQTCYIGSLGYFFLAWGMLNALYLFTLGKSSGPLQAIFIASIVNLTIGFFLSRMISYEYSVVGMLAGASVFAFLTFKEVKQFISKLDYHYYASY